MRIDNLDNKLKDLLLRLERLYRAKTRLSKSLYYRALGVFPGGVTYVIRYMSPYPIYITRARGTRVWDVDGNEYIDLWMGHGTHLLGHLARPVIEAIKESLETGTHIGFEHPYAVEYAELLTKTIPGIEYIRFTNSGTDANSYAIRLARAYTKRKYIVKMEGGWHGASNTLHVSVTYPYTHPESAGYLEDSHKYTLVIPFNDIEQLEKALKTHDIAAIILEPIMGAAGCIEPDPGYLKEVRKLTIEHGSLLILDEVITGFRLAPGGAQEYYGVNADIVVLGKALGGGAGSIGAFGGRGELMELLDHIKYPDVHERVAHSGTFIANLVVIKAGHAMVDYLVKNRSLYEDSNSMWKWFRFAIEKLCREHDILCHSTGDGSLVGIHFTSKKPRNAREAYQFRLSKYIEKTINLYFRVNGVLFTSEKMIHLLPSLIHTKEELGRLIELFNDFFEILRHEEMGKTSF
ncbi:MAG: aminotransferase class III-fold pyridoxal phosphate-dependent enzyme [Desulfurococcaceae archaeon]